jgi:acyl-CoA thioester hydrolase
MINSFVTSFSKTSFTMSQSIYRNKDIIVKSKVHLVFVNEEGKPTKIPENILKSLKPFLSIN